MTPSKQDASQGRSVGRPRDPSVRLRAIEAVLNIYHDKGLSGLNFETISRQASVGKASLYDRWGSVYELLVDALESSAVLPGDIDTGTVEDDLTALATQLWDEYSSEYGTVSIRVNLDSRVEPQLRAPYETYIASYRRAAREIVRRGIERGELDCDTSPLAVLDLVIGGVMVHVLLAGVGTDSNAEAAKPMIDALVQTVLHGVSSTPPK